MVDGQAELELASRIVREYMEDASDHWLRVTIRDVIRTVHTGPCHYGKRQSLTWREEGRVRNLYRFCHGLKCPRCAPTVLDKVLKRTFNSWDGVAGVYRSDFDAAEWTPNGRRARRLRAAYPKAYLSVLLTGGETVVFTPGPFEDSEHVQDVGTTIIEALLQAPADPGRRRRYTAPKAPPPPLDSEPADDGIAPEKPVTVNLPAGVRPEDLRQRFEAAISRALEWRAEGGGSSWRRWTAEGLSASEIDRVREVLQPFDDEYRAELASRKASRQFARDFEKMQTDTFPLSTSLKSKSVTADTRHRRLRARQVGVGR
jgi:hypothetical protein